MQAHRQWMSRAPDERFTSMLDMQEFKRRLRDNSRSHVISSRGLNVRPVEDDPRALQIKGYGNGLPAAAPTHWSFGQLCSLASPGNSPASYFRETQMPAPMIADCLNYNLRFTRGVEDIGVLLTTNEDGSVNELRSVNGPNYGRIYDAEVVDTLVEKFGDGVSGQWRVPGEFGKRVTVTKDNTTLYASDRDMFVFLADEENRIELPNRRAGRFGSFARGFFVWNSEVGKTTLGAGFFLFDYVCCNRIIWGADQYTLACARGSGFEVVEVKVSGRLVVNDLATKLTACAAGHGISQTFELGLDPLLASGELVQILADWAEERFPLYSYHPSRHLPPAKVRAFLDLVLASLAGS